MCSRDWRVSLGDVTSTPSLSGQPFRKVFDPPTFAGHPLRRPFGLGCRSLSIHRKQRIYPPDKVNRYTVELDHNHRARKGPANIRPTAGAQGDCASSGAKKTSRANSKSAFAIYSATTCRRSAYTCSRKTFSSSGNTTAHNWGPSNRTSCVGRLCSDALSR